MSLLYAIWNILWRPVVGYSLSVFSFFFKKRYSFVLLCTTLLVSLTAAACSDTPTSSGGSSTNAPQATAAPSELSGLHWCSKPAMVFRDQAAPSTATPATKTTLGPATGTPTTVNDWNTVKDNLGFTVFLPKTLPTGSCLLNVSGSLRDPIFGSNFTITYVLPDQNSISLSQAPSRAQSTSFQCSVSNPATGSGSTAKAGTPVVATPTPVGDPIQLCNGVRDKTNIVFSARGTTSTLEQFFQALQPSVDWVPAK